jgi:glycosyltransferase involved in cell wall biosynthesis
VPNAHRRRVRVVVLDHTAQRGGAELALVRLLDALPAEAVDVHVVLLADGPMVSLLREHGHSVGVLPLDPGVVSASRSSSGRTAAAQALRTAPVVVRLAGLLRRLRPDVLHTTSLKADLIGLAAGRLAAVPVVWHVHDRIHPDYLPLRTVRGVRGLARRGPRAVIANSTATARTLPGVRDLSVVWPGLAPDQVLGDLGRRRPRDPPVVGLLGRVSPTKGQLELVRAASVVLRERPTVRFRLVGAPLFGEREYASLVEREVSRLGLDAQVTIEGFSVDPTRVLDELSVLVHASPLPEPFGQVVVEGMARGVPVVATRAGGITEILEPDGPAGAALGVLVEPGDVTDLAAGILTALDAGPSAERAERAWTSAGQRFSAAATAAGVFEVWSRAAGTRTTDRRTGARLTD